MGRNLDVICQHSSGGEIIPLRIRIKEDDEYHTFTIKGYKNVSTNGAYTTPDDVYVTSNIMVFECLIDVFGQRKSIRFYFNKNSVEWSVVV